MSRAIPIKNLYYIFLYAWNQFPRGHTIDVPSGVGPGIADLFAKLLIEGTHRLLKKGLHKDYVTFIEATDTPRGRLISGETIKRGTLAKRNIICEYDDLSADVPLNRLIKASLKRLSEALDLTPSLARECSALVRRLHFVSDQPLSALHWHRVATNASTRNYTLLVHICRLVLGELLPGEGTKRNRFADLLEDEVKMSQIFENFVRSFYDREQQEFKVRANQIRWVVECDDPAMLTFLPTMKTDVTLWSSQRTIVIDTKFYKKTLERNRQGEEKIRSAHLYQLLSYLQQIPSSVISEGILLYPKIAGEDLRFDYRLVGHRVQVRTVDLMQPWREIHRELLEIVDERDGSDHSTPLLQ